MATWQRMETGDAGRLVYISKGQPLAGSLLSLFGLAGTVGTAAQLVVAYIQGLRDLSSLGGYATGALICVVLLVVGLKMLVSQEVVFDRAASVVVQTRRWLVWRHASTTKLAGFTAVLGDTNGATPTATRPPAFIRCISDDAMKKFSCSRHSGQRRPAV